MLIESLTYLCTVMVLMPTIGLCALHAQAMKALNSRGIRTKDGITLSAKVCGIDNQPTATERQNALAALKLTPQEEEELVTCVATTSYSSKSYRTT